jgi:hypothetical protein
MMFADCPPVIPLFLWPIFCLAYTVTTIGFTIALVLSLWRRTGRAQVSRRRLRATLLLWGPVAIRLAVPCPIQGDFVGNLTACKCDDHECVRFSGGRAGFFYETCLRENWGLYQKTGWNTFVLRENNGEPFPITIHTGWLFMKLRYADESRRVFKEDWLQRDFRFLRWMP